MNQPPTELETASVGQRFLAHLIDYFAVSSVLGLWLLITLSTLTGASLIVAIVFIGLLVLVYRILGDGIFQGAALGKRVMGIYVVDAQTRKPCSLLQAGIRGGMLHIGPMHLIEPILLACDGEQRWGDRVAKTYVLRREPKPAPVQPPMRPIKFDAVRESLKSEPEK